MTHRARSEAFVDVLGRAQDALAAGRASGAVGALLQGFAARPDCLASVALTDCGVSPGQLLDLLGAETADLRHLKTSSYRLSFVTADERRSLLPPEQQLVGRVSASTTHLLQAALAENSLQCALAEAGLTAAEVYARCTAVWSGDCREELGKPGEPVRPRLYERPLGELAAWITRFSAQGGVASEYARELKEAILGEMLSLGALGLEDDVADQHLEASFSALLVQAQRRGIELAIDEG